MDLNPSLATSFNGDGNTPLHVACSSISLETVRDFLEYNVDPNIISLDGNTPLHVLSHAGYEENDNDASERISGIIDLLLDAGADINQQNKRGETPLLYSLYYVADNGGDVLKKLLEKGADPNIQDKSGDTLLYDLVRHTSEDWTLRDTYYNIVLLLLEYGADPNIQNNLENTPLHLAIENNDYNMVLVLLEHGADPNIQNLYGNNAKELAEEGGNHEIIELFPDIGEFIKGYSEY
jgi:ankyrin repeat protein